ncbi:hypothetical protein [Pantoea sp. UYEF8]|uniref:hypothetical protein n=1 Tax=Pantoea sp. UYEF8 TaxID=1756394 RepID=UPI0033998311
MQKDFLLTYSVGNKYPLDEDREKADKVRRDIAQLTCWKKLDKVETTFSGSMDITGATDSDKKSSAKRNVRDQFIPILSKHGAKSLDVTIYCAIMIASVDGVYEFEVEN